MAYQSAIRIGRDVLLVGHKRLTACRSSPAILLTQFERPSRFQMFRRDAPHEHQLEALGSRVEAVVGANNGAEGRLDMLERHAAELTRLGGADQVRGDLKQHGLL